jgi:hypothetical protein
VVELITPIRIKPKTVRFTLVPSSVFSFDVTLTRMKQGMKKVSANNASG